MLKNSYCNHVQHLHYSEHRKIFSLMSRTFNSPAADRHTHGQQAHLGGEIDNELSLQDYGDMLKDNRWLIAGIIGVALTVGLIYATLATPIYRANLLLQIEDSAPESKSFLADTTGLGEVKTTANGEMQVIASRTILGAAVDQARLQVNAQPLYLPILGSWLARNSQELSEPGIFGFGGYVTGSERIVVGKFEVPAALEDTDSFTITVIDQKNYVVTHELFDAAINGEVGEPVQHRLPEGTITILIDELSGNPGAKFNVSVSSRLRAIEGLQNRLLLSEQGRQSNVVNVALEDSNPVRLGVVLNAIADQYIRQNVDRKSAEAEKTLAFLDAQLPLFERQLRSSEDAFARVRNQNGTIAFDEEAKVWLKSSADLQAKVLELQQNRLDLRRTNNESHPKIQTLNLQIAAIQQELAAVNKRITAMPNVQRDALRLERDVRANSAQYQSMQNNALQMRLVREGKVGNVRLLDKAAVSKLPVKPQKGLIVAFALVLGTLLSLGVSVARARTRRGIRTAAALSVNTGLEVLGVIPFSPDQASETGKKRDASLGKVLAETQPHSATIESIRTMRAAMKPVLALASNNRILFTAPTHGVGKNFTSTNFALLLAQTGKKVLFVDADLRKAGELGAFSLVKAIGLSEVLANQTSFEVATRREVRANLDVLTSGKRALLATDLLESDAFAALLERVSDDFDYVVINAAPVLVAAETLTMAPLCGSVIIVARAGFTEASQINESVRRLAQVGGSVSGCAFNCTA